MPNRVITISREFGSGGRTIGKLVAEKLGIPCYDAELIEKIAEQSGYSAEYIKQEVEYGTGGWLSAVFADRSTGLTNQDKMFSIQSRIIEELANESPCVIVGRCADYILQARADCLTVFVHADFKKRLERIVNEYGEPEEKAEKWLKDKDKRRMSYYNYYTNKKWGQADNYHVCLDSGELGIDKCVDILAQLY